MSKSSIITLTESKPTPLLRDFTTFCHYLSMHKIILTGTNEFISGKELYELNQKMTYPLLDTTPRTDQTLYPRLHLMYHIALAGILFRKVSENIELECIGTKHRRKLKALKIMFPKSVRRLRSNPDSTEP